MATRGHSPPPPKKNIYIYDVRCKSRGRPGRKTERRFVDIKGFFYCFKFFFFGGGKLINWQLVIGWSCRKVPPPRPLLHFLWRKWSTWSRRRFLATFPSSQPTSPYYLTYHDAAILSALAPCNIIYRRPRRKVLLSGHVHKYSPLPFM